MRSAQGSGDGTDADPSHQIPPTAIARKRLRILIYKNKIHDLQIHVFPFHLLPPSVGARVRVHVPCPKGPRLPPATLDTLCQAGREAAQQIFWKVGKQSFFFPPPSNPSTTLCFPGCPHIWSWYMHLAGTGSRVHESERQGRGIWLNIC